MSGVGNKYKISSIVWLYPGEQGAWHFVNVPKKQSKDIKEKFGKSRRGFGSLPVEASIGKTSWETSIFPDKKSETYLLPLKASVRKKEKFGDKDKITFVIKIVSSKGRQN